MTYKDIIEVLDACRKIHNCEKCPYQQRGMCIISHAQEAFDIIRHYKEENERLQNTLDDVLDRQPILVARAEKYAVEEFADMITDRASAVQVGNVSWVWQISQDDIDELVKAKVGEKR
jgi:hypothetical protein